MRGSDVKNNGKPGTEESGAEKLRTEDLSVGYGGTEILSGLSFAVRPGEILTLAGPNGAGKSTLLKTLARQLSPLKGTVYLCGQALPETEEKELSRLMSLIMTERVRTEYMTCGELASTGRYPYTGRLGILSPEDLTKVHEAMNLVGAEEFWEKDISRVSDGQRQLVMLARAICQEPEVLVMDEPTSFLDIRHKIEFLTTLRKLVLERNIAAVLSLHEPDLTKRISDTVVCVREGRADRIGDPEEILTGEYIETLYGMKPGSYGAFFGKDCGEAEQGKPETEKKGKQKKRYCFMQNRACEFFPCHKNIPEEEFNCLFCYCPLYALGERCGGAFRYLESGVKDCSGCGFPHLRGNYEKIIGRYPEIAALAAKRTEP
ncbi:MAG: ATP-binding cassette domain-containing protein [Stomatobaculum sp.]|nr:ATP-binding cassette domain-containing protein [Stomatobaculum sp.]